MVQNTYLVSLTSSQGFLITGTMFGDHVGYSVASAGDINNDGYDDIIIGSPYEYPSPRSIAYIIYGNSNSNTIDLDNLGNKGFAIYGTASSDKSGWSVSNAGDVNNDGYDDVIIGAPQANNNMGISYIIFGHAGSFSNINLATLSPTQGFAIVGSTSLGYSGFSVSGAGDVNKDGYGDIILGNAVANEAYVIYGNSSLPNSINLATLGNMGFSIYGAGITVSGLGDINNDGYSDVIAGDNSGVQSCYIIYGSSSQQSLLEVSELTASQGFTLYDSGPTCNWAGDINNDGLNDMLSTPSATTGINYLVYGFEESSNADNNSNGEGNIGLIAGTSAGAIALLGSIAGYACYAKAHHLWPFSIESLASQQHTHSIDAI